jgi:carbamoyl-phosphate synthase large subunit
LRILVTGVGSPGGPGIIKALRAKHEVFGADINARASGQKFLDQFFLVPPATNENFISHMRKLIIDQSIQIVVPLVTGELLKWACLKEELASQHDVIVMVDDMEKLLVSNDKELTYKSIECEDIVPKYHAYENHNELISLLEGEIVGPLPLVTKPAKGNGSRGVRVLTETIYGTKIIFDEKPGSLSMVADHYLGVIKDNQIPRCILCEYLPGKEVTIDAIASSGILEQIFIRERVETRAGISVAGRFIENIELLQKTQFIIEKLSLNGPVGLQFKQNVFGDYKLLEINPRLQGTSVATKGLGVNYPVLAVNHFIGMKKSMIPTKNVEFVRYYEEVFFDDKP